MNIELLELAAVALDDLLADVVFVGGATVGLWITDPVGSLLGNSRLTDGVAAALRPDTVSQERAELVVLPAMRGIADGS